jgi:nicotinamidase-related amidase
VAQPLDRFCSVVAAEDEEEKRLSSAPALLVIDVQKAIDDPSWGTDRNNPGAEDNIARLLAHWRHRSWPVFHVRHVSRDPNSTYRPGQTGADFKPEAAPRSGETIIEKNVNSAFIGIKLESELRARGIDEVVIAGVITNNSVEATARMSGNLGFRTVVIADATATFGRRDFAGRWHSADEVHAMSLANLDGEYATIVTTAGLLKQLA